MFTTCYHLIVYVLRSIVEGFVERTKQQKVRLKVLLNEPSIKKADGLIFDILKASFLWRLFLVDVLESGIRWYLVNVYASDINGLIVRMYQ